MANVANKRKCKTAKEVKEEIRKAGLKATGPRLKIYELFGRKGVRHLSAEDIYRQFGQEGVSISLATIYRVLTQFENVRLITRHQFKASYSSYELSGAHHDHMICNQCGCIVEFLDQAIEDLQNEVARKRDFKVVEHSLIMHVDCTRKNCKGRSQS